MKEEESEGGREGNQSYIYICMRGGRVRKSKLIPMSKRFRRSQCPVRAKQNTDDEILLNYSWAIPFFPGRTDGSGRLSAVRGWISTTTATNERIAINQGVQVNRINVIADAFSSRRLRLSILLSQGLKESRISSVLRARLSLSSD